MYVRKHMVQGGYSLTKDDIVIDKSNFHVLCHCEDRYCSFT